MFNDMAVLVRAVKKTGIVWKQAPFPTQPLCLCSIVFVECLVEVYRQTLLFELLGLACVGICAMF